MDQIQYNRPPFCLKCSRSLGRRILSPHCTTCLKSPPKFDFAWCACIYSEPLKSLIHQFKFSQKTLLRHLFANLLLSFIDCYQLDMNQFHYIIPIPLSFARFRERGYNQSALLAQAMSDKFSIPLSPNILYRSRNTRSQSLLNQKERWTNIQGAFRIKNQINLSGKSILLIDDLLTTGATCSEAALMLKNSGAKCVGVLTLAVAP